MGKVLHQKKKINLKLAIYILMITTILALITSASKFGTTVTGTGSAVVAVPVLETARITLENINPQMSAIEYDLVVENTKDNKKSQVALNYVIKVDNIGTVPLDIKIYKYDTENGTIIGDNILKDGQTEAITMPIEESVHTYKLEILWKEGYDSYLYSGETSYLEITVDAVQKD